MAFDPAANGGLPAFLLFVGNTIAVLAVRFSENPKNNRYEDVTRIQEYRWGDVCTELGPAVSAACEYIYEDNNVSEEDNEDNEEGDNLTDGDHPLEQLRDEEQATLALRKASDGPNLLGDTQAKLRQVSYPRWAYKVCHRSYWGAFVFFLLSIITAIVSLYFTTVDLPRPEIPFIPVSGALFVVGLCCILMHTVSAIMLERMTEDIDFLG